MARMGIPEATAARASRLSLRSRTGFTCTDSFHTASPYQAGLTSSPPEKTMPSSRSMTASACSGVSTVGMMKGTPPPRRTACTYRAPSASLPPSVRPQEIPTIGAAWRRHAVPAKSSPARRMHAGRARIKSILSIRKVLFITCSMALSPLFSTVNIRQIPEKRNGLFDCIILSPACLPRPVARSPAAPRRPVTCRAGRRLGSFCVFVRVKRAGWWDSCRVGEKA